MNYRIRINKKVGPWDGPRTEFSLETLVEGNALEKDFSKALENAFGSLRSFNAEMAKQEVPALPKAQYFYGVFEADGLIQGMSWDEISNLEKEGLLWAEYIGIEKAKQKECYEEKVKETGFGDDTACDPA